MAKKEKKAKAPAEPALPENSAKVPVALRFNADLLAKIDAMAKKRGMSRNAIISYWCSRALEME
jgi:hypothetical protein